MRSLDRSPGCTPIVGGVQSGRVRMHSRPGHDNFAPLKSVTASPGGTPHARGQGRLPSVRVSPLAAAGHDQFNPLRSQVASPGCTPVRSASDSVADDAPSSDFDNAAGSGTILPYAPEPSDLLVPATVPVARSDDTTHTDTMHVVVVNAPGHEDLNPVCTAMRSPGYTPRQSCSEAMEVAPTVHGSSAPGQNVFVSMHAGSESLGHMMVDARADTSGPEHVCIKAPPGNDSFNPLSAGQRSPGHTPRPPITNSRQHAEHVTFVSSPSHDIFRPLAAGNASPGHTPRPSMETVDTSPVHVTFQSAPGHDHFDPIQAAGASPGQTPRHPLLRAQNVPTVGLIASQSQSNGKRVSIDVDVPLSHNYFQPMRMADESPGQTPRVPGRKVVSRF